MKVRIYFKGLGSWYFDFVSEEEYEEYIHDNKNNISKIERI